MAMEQSGTLLSKRLFRVLNPANGLFYVSKNGHVVNVIVAKSAQGNKYIKTENDGDQPDNLLSLPECI